MFVGEAPGAEDDRRAVVVGRAGRRLPSCSGGHAARGRVHRTSSYAGPRRTATRSPRRSSCASTCDKQVELIQPRWSGRSATSRTKLSSAAGPGSPRSAAPRRCTSLGGRPVFIMPAASGEPARTPASRHSARGLRRQRFLAPSLRAATQRAVEMPAPVIPTAGRQVELPPESGRADLHQADTRSSAGGWPSVRQATPRCRRDGRRGTTFIPRGPSRRWADRARHLSTFCDQRYADCRSPTSIFTASGHRGRGRGARRLHGRGRSPSSNGRAVATSLEARGIAGRGAPPRGEDEREAIAPRNANLGPPTSGPRRPRAVAGRSWCQ